MTPRHGSRVAPAAAAVLALLVAAARPATAQRVIGMGGSVTDTVGATDPLLPSDQSHDRPFSFYGTAGRTVQLDLRSNDFTPRLVLEDWEGQTIAADDDAGRAPNAHIWYNLPYTGIYQVLASAHGADEHGTFTLSLRETQPHVLPPNPDAPALVTTGTIRLNQEVEAVLAPSASTYDNRKYNAYAFHCSAGQQFQMDVLSDWDNYAMVVDPGGNVVSRDGDSGGSTNARLVHACATSGDYRLLVATSSPYGSVGRYTLHVQTYGTPARVLAEAEPVAAPEPVAPPQPAVQLQPAAQAQPVVAPPAEPTAQPQPVAPQQPAARPEPVAQTQPTAGRLPAARPQPEPVAPPQPTVRPEPAAQAQPVVAPPAEPTAQPQRAAPQQPTVQPKPVVQPQPAAEPAAQPQPEPVAPPQPAVQPESAAQPPQPAVAPPAPASPEATPTGLVPSPGEIGQIAVGQTAQGQLEPGDQTMAGMFADTWQFQGRAGLTVTIEVTSTAFSPYVQLYDATGIRLADGSAAAGGDSARLAFTLRTTALYQVVVVNSEGQRQTGPYTLSVR
jgi:hypothetical protein